jgi:hypothetical protein
MASAIQRGFCHRLLITGGDITSDSGDDLGGKATDAVDFARPRSSALRASPDPPGI